MPLPDLQNYDLQQTDDESQKARTAGSGAGSDTAGMPSSGSPATTAPQPPQPMTTFRQMQAAGIARPPPPRLQAPNGTRMYSAAPVASSSGPSSAPSPNGTGYPVLRGGGPTMPRVPGAPSSAPGPSGTGPQIPDHPSDVPPGGGGTTPTNPSTAPPWRPGQNPSPTGGTAGYTPEPGSFEAMLQDKIMGWLSNPQSYGSEDVQHSYDNLSGSIDDAYNLEKTHIDEEMAGRGIYDSTIAGGRLHDLNIGTRTARQQMGMDLIDRQAQSRSSDLAAAVNAGIGNRQIDVNRELAWNSGLEHILSVMSDLGLVGPNAGGPPGTPPSGPPSGPPGSPGNNGPGTVGDNNPYGFEPPEHPSLDQVFAAWDQTHPGQPRPGPTSQALIDFWSQYRQDWIRNHNSTSTSTNSANVRPGGSSAPQLEGGGTYTTQTSGPPTSGPPTGGSTPTTDGATPPAPPGGQQYAPRPGETYDETIARMRQPDASTGSGALIAGDMSYLPDDHPMQRYLRGEINYADMQAQNQNYQGATTKPGPVGLQAAYNALVGQYGPEGGKMMFMKNVEALKQQGKLNLGGGALDFLNNVPGGSDLVSQVVSMFG